MPETIIYTRRLTVLSCGDCHIPFAIPENLYNNVYGDGSYFYCPNGHRIHYHETDNERLKNELARTKTSLLRERDAHAFTERQRRAEKGAKTKLKKRTMAGVCPVPGCKRHFQNVQAHIERMHPDHKIEA